MFDHAKNLEFEKAARVRDQLALSRNRYLVRAGRQRRGADALGEGGMTGTCVGLGSPDLVTKRGGANFA